MNLSTGIAGETRFQLRRLVQWFAVALVLVIAALVFRQSVLLNDDYFPVNELQLVSSFEQVDADAIKALIEPELGRNFFALPVDRIHDQVIALPWVAQVWVDRVFPDILRLRVLEQKPIARWGDSTLLGQDGDVFTVETGAFEHLPLLSGPEGSLQQVLAFYRFLGQQLDPKLLPVSRVEMDERHSWKFVTGRVEVILGRDEHELRLRRFVRYWNSLSADRQQQVDKIDLRYTNGFAVRWAKTPLSRESH